MTAPPGATQPNGPARPWFEHYESGVPHEVSVPDETLDEILRATAERYPERAAIDFLGARTTFRELDDAVDRFARALLARGLRPGDRVSLHLPNSPAFVIALLGTLRAGGIAAPSSPLLVERELDILLRQTTPRFSVCLDLLVPRVRAIRTAIEGQLADGALFSTGIRDWLPAPIRWLYPLAARREGRWHPVPHSAATPNLGRLLRETPGGRIDSPGAPDDPAVLQPTGGTTGIPKAATLTHRNLVANALQTAAWFPDARPGQETALCVVPYFHIYGLTVAMNYAILIGATQVLHPRFDPLAVLKSIARTRPRTFPGAPMMYATLAAHPAQSRYDLRSIEACISGAAPLTLDVQRRFEEITHGRVSEGYGLTEASPVTHCNPIQGQRKIGTIGLPFPSTDARVVDLETGERTLGPGEIGELIVRGPQVMAGYWHQPEETAAVLRDGWLFTGDVATMDEEGYFRIVDRRKDMIIVGGINVYPREVEEVLMAHPGIAEAAVVGEPEELRGEVPRAYVVLEPPGSLTEEEILAWCRENLSRYKVPVAIEFRTELPRTFIGKVLRRVLAEDRLQPSPASPAGGGQEQPARIDEEAETTEAATPDDETGLA
ncbi:MAG: long-chain fatty acid--CoA ligase [Chloroflexota bacterium]